MARRDSVRIDVIVHATESAERIAGSFGALGLDPGIFAPRHATGHFGNQITVLEAGLGGDDARRFVRAVARALPAGGARQAASGSISGSTLYVRLDKQRLAGGAVRLAGGDPVRVRITAGAHGGGRAAFEEMFGLD